MLDQNNNDQELKFAESFLNPELSSGYQQIDFKSEKATAAIKVLSDTYRYASLCVESASYFAQRIHEMKSDNPGLYRTVNFQACYRKYIYDVDARLNEFAKSLTTIVRQNSYENFVDLVASQIGSYIKYLKNQLKEVL